MNTKQKNFLFFMLFLVSSFSLLLFGFTVLHTLENNPNSKGFWFFTIWLLRTQLFDTMIVILFIGMILLCLLCCQVYGLVFKA